MLLLVNYHYKISHNAVRESYYYRKTRLVNILTIGHYEIRYAIDESFRKHGVQIPFPQHDVYIKSNPKSDFI